MNSIAIFWYLNKNIFFTFRSYIRAFVRRPLRGRTSKIKDYINNNEILNLIRMRVYNAADNTQSLHILILSSFVTMVELQQLSSKVIIYH